MAASVAKIGLIALGGALGALCRYGLSGLVHDRLGAGFPWGTAAVNVAGCFFFGLVFTLAEERLLVRPEVRVFLLVGFAGAFTTFSTYVFETEQLLRDSQWLFAGCNVAGQLFFGFAALYLGTIAARMV